MRERAREGGKSKYELVSECMCVSECVYVCECVCVPLCFMEYRMSAVHRQFPPPGHDWVTHRFAAARGITL